MMAKSEKSSFQLKILYGEGDAEVLASQVVSIQKAGHQVETAVGRKSIDEAVRQGRFDLVILGPTLTKNDRHHLPYVIKKAQTATRILVMHTDGEGHPAVDANLDTGRSMADVVAKIASLMATGEIASNGLAQGAAAGK
jgi:DNA-binding NtrC family response regulator